MPYRNGQYVAPHAGSTSATSASSLFTGPKPKKKKKDQGDGGFLGTGIGPSLSSIVDEGIDGVKGVGKDFIGLGSMVGQTASDFVWAGRDAISGNTEQAKKDLGLKPTFDKNGRYVPRGIGTIGAATVGMASSIGGTVGDILDYTTPDIGGVDLGGLARSGTQELIEGAAKASADNSDQNTAAEQVASDLRPRTYMDRAAKRGFLSPIVEDIGNVALVGGALTKGAGLAGAVSEGRLGEFHPLGGEANHPTTMAADAGGAIAKVDKVGRALAHPLKGTWDGTVGQLSDAANQRTLRSAAEIDPLLKDYAEETGNVPVPEEGVVQQARKISGKRSAKMSKVYETGPGIDSSGEGGAVVDTLGDTGKADLAARVNEEKQIYDWLQSNGHVQFEHVPAADNPYYIDSMGTERGWEPGQKMDIEAHRAAVNKDITENGHMYVDKTGSFGEEISPGIDPQANDIRRAVHDFLGHRRGEAASYSQPGENLAYQNESAWFGPEAKRSVGFDQLGLTAYLKEHGAFPTEQRVGSLPTGMSDPEYLSGAAPWARKVVDHFDPNGFVNKTLTRLEGMSKAAGTKSHARELSIMVEAERNRLAHSEAATTSVEGARYLVDKFKMKPEDANTVVHDVLKDRITGREAVFQDMVAKDPTFGPYLEDAGWVPEETKIENAIGPENHMTPEQGAEFGDIMSHAHAAWETQLAERINVLKESRPGMKGLEDVGREEVIPTKGQVRKQKEIDSLVAEAGKLRQKALKAETEVAEKQISGHEADIQARAGAIQKEVQTQQGAAERLYNERVWEAKGFKGTKWEDKTIPAIINKTLETGGATWNPFYDHFIEPKWGTPGETPLPPGVQTVPGEGFAVSIFPRVKGPNGEPPMSTFEVPVANAADILPGLLDRMKGFAPLYENPDISIGTWLDKDTGTVHVDLSQTTIDGKPISRDQAMLLANARNQLSVTDMGSATENFPGAPGSVRISRQMLNSSKEGLAARQSVARRLYEGAASTVEMVFHDGRTKEGPTYPWITAEDIDAHMSALDYQAWVAHRAHPEKYPTPADVYKDMEFRFSRDASRLPHDPNRLTQTYLGATINKDLWTNATAAVKDWETKVAPWYHKSRQFIDKHFGGKEVTLLDGSKRPADEFFTDALAVLSVSADPGSNLKYALTSYDNLGDFLKAHDYNIDRVKELVDGMMSKDPKKRDTTALFGELTKDTHLYPSPKKPLFDLLNGTKLDDMTPEYFASVPEEQWGAGAKSVTAKMKAAADEHGGMDTPAGQQAAMEEGGSRFYAKIKSFKDNLTDPANSTSVTLDSWMARLFGEQDWMGAGKYRDYANQLRDLATEVSAREGREVKPHEVQAVLWAYAKQEIGRIDAGKFRNDVNGVMRAIDEGTWDPRTNDTVLDGFDLDQAQLDRALERQTHNRSRMARRDELATEANGGGVMPWNKVSAAEKKRIMAQVDAEVGAKKPGAWHPETEKVTIHRSDRPGPETVDRTTAITRPLESTGAKENQADYIQRNLEAYTVVAEEAYNRFQEGDTAGAKQLINGWSAKKLAKMEASANEFGDFQDVVNGASEGLSDAMDRHGWTPETLLQSYNRDVKGSFLLNEDGKALTHFFQTADATTLTHEGAHMLRTMLSDEDMHALESNLGFTPGERWNRGREEQFANMVTAWMATDSVPEGLRPLMQRLKATLGEGYTEFNRRFNSDRINPETDQMFREFFSDATVPDITREVQMMGKRPNIPINPDTGNPMLGAPEVRGGPMAAGTAPNLETVSSPDAYRMGSRAQKIRGEIAKSDQRIRENLAGMARANKAKDSLQQMLEDEMLPGQKAARALEKRASGRQATLDAALESAPSRQWPREFRPMGEAFDSLVKDSESNPALAAALEDVSANFPAVVARMKELGGDPAHIRDFTEGEVKKLMYDTIRLGDVGKLGKETAAGTRKTWTGALAREGKNARSIEALGAAIVETHHELRTNQLVDYIEQSVAVPWHGQQELPHGYAEWDPIRNKMTGKEGEATSNATRYIVPKQVDTVLKRMNQDFNHGIFRGLSKVTSPWRGLILTMSPRWYVNNFAGNLILATLEGVRLKDWHAAWDSYKNKDAGGRYADVPAVQGHAFVSDVGERNMVPTDSVKEAYQTGDGVGNKINRARKQIGHNMRRANEVVDEFARSAVYHRSKRIGMTEEASVIRAQRALVDYGDMSPMEQQIVRSVVPFYAWQKNILKIVAKMPIDHPVAAGVMMKLGSLQNQLNEDRYGGELPLGYAGLVGTPGGAINTRGFNPFADSLSLGTPEGIAGSINPFADILLRKALGAPDGGFVQQRALSSYGTAVPDIPVGTSLGDIGAGVPGFQIGQAATGGGDKGLGQQSLKFVGLNYLTADDIKKVLARTKAAKEQIAANAPFPAKKKKAKVPGSLTGPIL